MSPTMDEFGPYLQGMLDSNPEFKASYEAARDGKWGPSVSDDEQAAMASMDIQPGFHDFSSQQVLDAYRAGVEAGREAGVEAGREAGFTSGQESIYYSPDYQGPAVG